MNKEIDIKEINELIEKESAFIDMLLLEVNKVIIGQKHMMERLLIGLLGHEKNLTLGKFKAFNTLIALESLLLIPLSKSAIFAEIAILLLDCSRKTPFIFLLIPDHA